jgi:hypothetical protein
MKWNFINRLRLGILHHSDHARNTQPIIRVMGVFVRYSHSQEEASWNSRVQIACRSPQERDVSSAFLGILVLEELQIMSMMLSSTRGQVAEGEEGECSSREVPASNCIAKPFDLLTKKVGTRDILEHAAFGDKVALL